jgi:hypothetical protein
MRTEAPPTVKQVYATAAALCEGADEQFPTTRGEASELIRKLRGEPPVADPRPSIEGGDSTVLA